MISEERILALYAADISLSSTWYFSTIPCSCINNFSFCSVLHQFDPGGIVVNIMNDHLVVVALTGGMCELARLISEHGFSGIVGGNKNISFLVNFNNSFNFNRELVSAYGGIAYGRHLPIV